MLYNMLKRSRRQISVIIAVFAPNYNSGGWCINKYDFCVHFTSQFFQVKLRKKLFMIDLAYRLGFCH